MRSRLNTCSKDSQVSWKPKLILLLAWVYLLALLTITYFMWSRFNGHWLLTLFLFSPRWAVALPLAILLPATLWFRPRLAWFYAVHCAVIVFAVLGFELRGFQKLDDAAMKTPVHVLTCNIGGGTLDEEALVALVRERKINIVLLQECLPRTAKSFYAKLQWNYKHQHSLAIGSSMELSDHQMVNRPLRRHARPPVALDCQVRLPDGEEARFVSVHLPTFRPALRKMQEFDFINGPKAMQKQGQAYRSIVQRLRDHLATIEIPTVLAGDFNVPIESTYYQDYWASMTNAYSEKGLGLGYTKFTRLHGIRIDHVLVDECWQVLSTQVGPHLGGDHRPVITKLVKISSVEK
ncbi:endonuclease/exonuclease/phosphatase family protein [Rubripirellula obstinata]|nr:endonuclease/exonuclease/phosphatase family protein [Rubripirellula obstinata]